MINASFWSQYFIWSCHNFAKVYVLLPEKGSDKQIIRLVAPLVCRNCITFSALSQMIIPVLSVRSLNVHRCGFFICLRTTGIFPLHYLHRAWWATASAWRHSRTTIIIIIQDKTENKYHSKVRIIHERHQSKRCIYHVCIVYDGQSDKVSCTDKQGKLKVIIIYTIIDINM